MQIYLLFFNFYSQLTRKNFVLCYILHFVTQDEGLFYTMQSFLSRKEMRQRKKVEIQHP